MGTSLQQMPTQRRVDRRELRVEDAVAKGQKSVVAWLLAGETCSSELP